VDLLAPKMLVAAAATLALGSSPVAQVTATLRAETRAFNARHWQAFWKLQTPRYRSTCGYAKFVAAERRFRAQVGVVKTTNIRVRVVSPKRAVAEYDFVTQSHQRFHDHGDVYAKVGSRWLDDLDEPGRLGCGY
jgi:hypothetical protein